MKKVRTNLSLDRELVQRLKNIKAIFNISKVCNDYLWSILPDKEREYANKIAEEKALLSMNEQEIDRIKNTYEALKKLKKV